MKRALLWVVDHPLAAAVFVLAVTVLLAMQLPSLRIDESAEGLMVEKDPARAFYEQAKQRFGSDNLTIVLVKADEVFTAPALTAVKRLSDALERVPGVGRVESLTTAKNIKGEGDSLNTDPLIGADVPTAPADLARVRADALGNRVLVGNLLAADARATAIVVYTNAPPGDTEFNRRFTAQVDALIARETRPGLTVHQFGAPMTKSTYTQYLKEDQRTITPASVTVLIVTLWIAMRTLHGVVIPVATALVSIVWALGLMALTGIPVNILTSIIPSLILCIGFTEDVHMITAFEHRLALGHDRLSAIRHMVAESVLPILVTTATTVIGFGSLITTDITMLIQFGYASAMGLTGNWVVTMLLVPVMLRWWRRPRVRARPAGDDAVHGRLPRAMERLAEFNIRHRAPILLVWGAIAAVSLVGWFTLRVNTDLLSYFPERSVIRQRAADLHRSLSGGLAFSIVVDTGRDDGIKDPSVLRRIAGLQEFLAATGRVDKTVSVADYVRKMHREMHGGDPAFEVVPDTAEQVAQYLLMLEGRELEKFVDFKAAAANIVVRHHLTGSGDLSDLRRDIERHVAGGFPAALSVRVTGEEILFNNASDYMAINELTSFAGTFVIIGLIHAFLFMSLKAGGLSLVPNIVPMLTLYGVMGLLGIPLNTGTAMIATMGIGIAVDDTVHHMVTYSRQLKRHHDQRLAMVDTLRSEGRPIIYVSLALIAGFLTLIASNFVATVYFGVLAAFVMLVAVVAELTLAPILMYSTQLVTVWDMLMLRMSRDLVRHAPLFQGLSRWEARKVVLLGGLREYAPGEFVVRKGESGAEMYMVVSGRLRVFDSLPGGGERPLTVLGPGAIFGEIALLTKDVRSASVVAEEPAALLRLDAEALERIRKRFPYTAAKLFRNIARMLGERLREVTAQRVEASTPV